MLLGASNLTLSFPWTRAAALAATGQGPGEILVAAGIGRAYGVSSRILLRERSAILDSELWQHLEAAHRLEPLPVYALLTDLGNDLAYGSSAAALTAALAECLARLRPLAASCVATAFPLASIERLSPFRFTLLASVLFPGHAISRSELLAQGRVFNQSLRELCARAACVLVEIPPECFGLDHIHLTWRWRRRLWPEVLAAWHGPAADRSQRPWVGQPPVESSTAWY